MDRRCQWGRRRRSKKREVRTESMMERGTADYFMSCGAGERSTYIEGWAGKVSRVLSVRVRREVVRWRCLEHFRDRPSVRDRMFSRSCLRALPSHPRAATSLVTRQLNFQTAPTILRRSLASSSGDSSSGGLSHIDRRGEASMVDVSNSRLGAYFQVKPCGVCQNVSLLL